MKTKNNVWKAAFGIAVFLSGFLFIFTVAASAPDSGMDSKDSATILAVNLSEKTMMVENQAASEALSISAAAALAPASEAGLEVENWMLDESNFAPEAVPEEKPGNSKKIEIWKVQNEKYGNRKFILTQVKDKPLCIEYWMLDNYYW